MKTRTAIALTVLAGSVTAPACLSVAEAQTLPRCGGQSAAPQPVPYRCILPPKTLHGTTFAGLVTANGTDVRVTIQIGQVVAGQFVAGLGTRNVPTPALIEHHEGVSGASGPSDLRRGTIPPGGFQITLIDSSPCREGQLDVFVVDVETKGDANRLGGPWIQNGTDCTTPPPASSVPTTAPPTAPPANTPGAPSPGPGASTPNTLPATGLAGDIAGWTIVTLLVAGITLIAVAGRKRQAS